MRARHLRFLALAAAMCVASVAFAQTTPPTSGPVKITLDDAIQMALQHNHNLLAQRTVVQQNQAEEITANLRPNPVLQGDAQFLPIFQPDKFSADYITRRRSLTWGSVICSSADASGSIVCRRRAT